MSPDRYDVDLFVIGGGSGGVRAARVSASMGARVALAEERYLGGTCVNVGCVPKKLLWYGAHHRDLLAGAKDYGWSFDEPRFDWGTLLRNKDREIARLGGVYRRLLESVGVEVIEHRARLLDPRTIEVDGRRITARHILIATGGWPRPLDIPGVDLTITSNEVFALERVPERLVVAGGGYIAVELAGILHALGAKVELSYRGALFLRGFDGEIRRHLAEAMLRQGIGLHFETELVAVKQSREALSACLSDGRELACDAVLCAVGRDPASGGLGLEEVGVELGPDRRVVVDRFSQTRVPGIWAIGDVTGRLNLTPAAIHEAMCLARTLFADEPTAPDLELAPTAVFSQPPIAVVGLTEEQACGRYPRVDVYVSAFRPLRASLGDSLERTLMKLIVERDSQRVLGLHVLGEDAAEIVQGAAIAVRMGATKGDFDRTLGIHPTSAEELVTMREATRQHG